MDTAIIDGCGFKVFVEGLPIRQAQKIFLLVHGFGTDLHERGLFDEIAKAPRSSKDTAVARFNFPKLEAENGIRKEKPLGGMAGDLRSVLNYAAGEKKEDAFLTTIGFSMGSYVIAKCFSAETPISPDKIILINPPRIDFKKELQNHFQNKPGLRIDDKGVWALPREDGSMTYAGPEFWDSVKKEEQLREFRKLVDNFPSYLVKAMDDITAGGMDEEMRKMPFKEIVRLKGDHNFSNLEDRANFIRSLTVLLKK
jgi:pimeloyl-ACP methyl ester carboxylesterase